MTSALGYAIIKVMGDNPDKEPTQRKGTDKAMEPVQEQLTQQTGSLTANHIHAHSLDVLSSLRIAQLRYQNDRMIRSSMNDSTTGYAPDQEFYDDCRDLETRIDNLLHSATPLGNAAVRLNDKETIILSHAVSEATYTARDDQMPRCADSLSELHRQLTSGRSPMILVFGTCSACWPIRTQRQVSGDNTLAEPTARKIEPRGR